MTQIKSHMTVTRSKKKIKNITLLVTQDVQITVYQFRININKNCDMGKKKRNLCKFVWLSVCLVLNFRILALTSV